MGVETGADTRMLLRHSLATLAYRGGKAVDTEGKRFVEHYFVADMVAGRVGRDQAAPHREFD